MAINLAQLLGLAQPGKRVNPFAPDSAVSPWTINNLADGDTPGPPIRAPESDTQIIVDGSSPTAEGMGNPEPPLMGNRAYLEETARVAENAPPRSGMFGIGGTLRDVLGTIGDAFLVQSGNDSVYAPRRQQERESDALAGFTNADPAAAMAAIERLAQTNPEAAREMLTQFQDAQYKDAARQSLDASRQSVIDNRQADLRETGLDRISRWVGGGLPYERILAGAAQYGITEEQLNAMGVTPDMSNDDRSAFASGDMTRYQQEQLPRRDAQLEISRRNADTARISATRPRAASQPRSQTALEYYQELSNIPEAERTADQRAWMADQVSTGSNRRPGIAPPPPASAARPASRLRMLNP